MLTQHGDNVVLYFIADVDECADNTDSCVAMGSHCFNTIGSYECTCDLGYMGDGIICIGVFMVKHSELSSNFNYRHIKYNNIVYCSCFI